MSKPSLPQAKRRSRADLALLDDPFEEVGVPAARLRHFYQRPDEDSRPTHKADQEPGKAAPNHESRKRGERQKGRGDGEQAGHRGPRLTHLLSEELAFLFENEVSDPNLRDLQILEVDLSVDYRNARVLVCPKSPRGAAPIEEALQRADGFLRRRLLDALDLKHAIALSIKVRASP